MSGNNGKKDIIFYLDLLTDDKTTPFILNEKFFKNYIDKGTAISNREMQVSNQFIFEMSDSFNKLTNIELLNKLYTEYNQTKLEDKRKFLKKQYVRLVRSEYKLLNSNIKSILMNLISNLLKTKEEEEEKEQGGVDAEDRIIGLRKEFIKKKLISINNEDKLDIPISPIWYCNNGDCYKNASDFADDEFCFDYALGLNLLTDPLEDLSQQIKNYSESVGNKITELKALKESAAKTLGNKLKESATNATNTVRAAAKTVGDAAGSATKAVTGAVRDAAGLSLSRPKIPSLSRPKIPSLSSSSSSSGLVDLTSSSIVEDIGSKFAQGAETPIEQKKISKEIVAALVGAMIKNKSKNNDVVIYLKGGAPEEVDDELMIDGKINEENLNNILHHISVSAAIRVYFKQLYDKINNEKEGNESSNITKKIRNNSEVNETKNANKKQNIITTLIQNEHNVIKQQIRGMAASNGVLKISPSIKELNKLILIISASMASASSILNKNKQILNNNYKLSRFYIFENKIFKQAVLTAKRMIKMIKAKNNANNNVNNNEYINAKQKSKEARKKLKKLFALYKKHLNELLFFITSKDELKHHNTQTGGSVSEQVRVSASTIAAIAAFMRLGNISLDKSKSVSSSVSSSDLASITKQGRRDFLWWPKKSDSDDHKTYPYPICFFCKLFVVTDGEKCNKQIICDRCNSTIKIEYKTDNSLKPEESYDIDNIDYFKENKSKIVRKFELCLNKFNQDTKTVVDLLSIDMNIINLKEVYTKIQENQTFLSQFLLGILNKCTYFQNNNNKIYDDFEKISNIIKYKYKSILDDDQYYGNEKKDEFDILFDNCLLFTEEIEKINIDYIIYKIFEPTTVLHLQNNKPYMIQNINNIKKISHEDAEKFDSNKNNDSLIFSADVKKEKFIIQSISRTISKIINENFIEKKK